MTLKPPDGPPRPDGNSDVQGESVSLARRRLLRMGVYAAPVVVGTLLVSRKAMAQTTSCNPPCCPERANQNCNPCRP
jgi:hypothetical protein